VEYIFAAALIVGGIIIVVRQFTKGEETPQVEEPELSEDTAEEESQS
jgi:hypothetical protein